MAGAQTWVRMAAWIVSNSGRVPKLLPAAIRPDQNRDQGPRSGSGPCITMMATQNKAKQSKARQSKAKQSKAKRTRATFGGRCEGPVGDERGEAEDEHEEDKKVPDVVHASANRADQHACEP
eukprot:1339655-Rhodomonas_salina.3